MSRARASLGVFYFNFHIQLRFAFFLRFYVHFVCGSLRFTLVCLSVRMLLFRRYALAMLY